MCDKESSSKTCIHAKIRFTSTALISLQPEVHKLSGAGEQMQLMVTAGEVGYIAGRAPRAEPSLSGTGDVCETIR